MTTTFRVEGMHCASCKYLIEDVCREIPGIQSGVLDFDRKILAIEHASEADLSLVEKEIAKVGDYRVIGA
ncbi:heavy-metal-associated domain-containing protein [Patescibacteria group bacterium]|nr:heavy-metal-associated domain-containing protein [Patescibacteria group bacterium]